MKFLNNKNNGTFASVIFLLQFRPKFTLIILTKYYFIHMMQNTNKTSLALTDGGNLYY